MFYEDQFGNQSAPPPASSNARSKLVTGYQVFRHGIYLGTVSIAEYLSVRNPELKYVPIIREVR